MKNKFYIFLFLILLIMGCGISKTTLYLHDNYYFKYIDKQSVCFCGFTYDALRNLDGDTLYIPSKIYGLSVVKIEYLGYESIIGVASSYYYKAVKKIIIPSTVKVIGGFYNCENLQDISLPEGLEIIENTAFKNCKSLKKITLPSTLKEIGYCAFSACSSSTNITFKDTSGWYIQYGEGIWNIIDVSNSTNNANILKIDYVYDGYRLEKRY